MNIGIDIGWTIKGVRSEDDKNKIAPESFRVISNLVKNGHKISLISRVTSEQKERAEQWLKDVDFFNKTGVHPDELYFCFDRRDKSLFVRALGIKLMIDDRAEVMAYIDPQVIKILINPEITDLKKFQSYLLNPIIFNNWIEIEKFFEHLWSPNYIKS